MLQFKNILVPLDFSDKNQEAIDIALDLANTNNARVTLLHVIESIDLSGDQEVENFVSQLRQRALQKLDQAAEPFRRGNLEVNTTTRIGNRAREISAFEDEFGIDLIIVSSHTIDMDEPARSLATLEPVFMSKRTIPFTEVLAFVWGYWRNLPIRLCLIVAAVLTAVVLEIQIPAFSGNVVVVIEDLARGNGTVDAAWYAVADLVGIFALLSLMRQVYLRVWM